MVLETQVFPAMCVCVCVYSATQSYPTLCDPMGCSPPGSSVHGISQRQEHWNGLSLPSLAVLLIYYGASTRKPVRNASSQASPQTSEGAGLVI